MGVSHHKLLMVLAITGAVAPSLNAFDIDISPDVLDIGISDNAVVNTAVLGALAATIQVANGVVYAKKKFSEVKEPYKKAYKYLTNVAEGAKVGSMRVQSKSHWLSTGIEPLSQIHGLGWLRHVSFAARRGPDMLHLFVNQTLTPKQKAIAVVLGVIDPIASVTGFQSVQDASTYLRNNLGLEEKESLGNDKHSLLQKVLLAGMHIFAYRDFAGDSAGIQYALEQIFESCIHYGVYTYRGNSQGFHDDKWALLNASPKFQRAVNRLLYSMLTEIGIVQGMSYGVQKGVLGDNLLGRFGIDAALFAKSMLMPALIYRARFGKNMPQLGTFVHSNLLRTVLKILLTRIPYEMSAGHRNVSDPVFVALRACENEGLFDRQFGGTQLRLSQGFDFIYDFILRLNDMRLKAKDVHYGKDSINAKEIMLHSRDYLYKMKKVYPPEFFASMEGTTNIMAYNQVIANQVTPGYLPFDEEVEVAKRKAIALQADSSAVEEILRSCERERALLVTKKRNLKDLLEGKYGSLLTGLFRGSKNE